jgi:hypothetical protein
MSHETESSMYALERYKALRAHELLLNRATAEFERAALQPLFLLNGGAVVAFLTLLGAVWGKPPTSLNLQMAKEALVAWCIGLLGAAIATSFGYLSQRRFAMSSRLEREEVEAALSKGLVPSGASPVVTKSSAKVPKLLQRSAYIFACGSLGAFIFGAFRALAAITPT